MSQTTAPVPSSATTGFFQRKPVLENQYREDHTFRRILDCFLPVTLKTSIDAPFAQFGDAVISPQVLFWLRDAELHPPTLVLRDSFGVPHNELITSEGWRQLQDFGLREGIVATGYEDQFGLHTRLIQFAKLHLFAGSSSTVTCPSAMQDGAAKLIKQYLGQHRASSDLTLKATLESAYARLTSRDPSVAWTSGQWMTERTGGSDVSGTETYATKLSPAQTQQASNLRASDHSPLGPWSVDGFKWFSSATDADMCFFLAKTASVNRVSLFFAPLRQTDGSISSYNGIFPQRLKNKLGTKPLPTAELELKGLRAYLLGQEGHGTKEISPILNITRVYNAVSSVGSFGRGLAVSRAFARVRRALGGHLLIDVPAHVKSLAYQHVQYRGHSMTVYFMVYLLGITEQKTISDNALPLLSSPAWSPHLLRLLTPIVKALSAVVAIDGTRFCMESLGGIGYLENEDIELNVAKLFRDTNVLAIWEGTTDVLAADTIRVLKGTGAKEALSALRLWTESIVGKVAVSLDLDLRPLTKELDRLQHLVQTKGARELLYLGRDILYSIHWVVTCALLAADAARDGDVVALEVAKRWLAQRDSAVAESLSQRAWEQSAALDRRLVFGDSSSVEAKGARM